MHRIRRTTRRTTTALATALALALPLTSCGLLGGGDDEAARRTAPADAYLKAVARQDWKAAAAQTTDPGAAERYLRDIDKRLRLSKAAADRTGGQLTEEDGGKSGKDGGKPGTEDGAAGTSARFPAKLTLTAAGATPWSYRTTLTAVPSPESGDDGAWKLRWSPSLVHPALDADTTLGRSSDLPERAPIEAADGTPLADERPVWAISIWPAKYSDPEAGYRALDEAELGTDLDTGALRDRVEKAEPEQAVPVITLRDEVYQRVKADLDLPGFQHRQSSRPLALHAPALVGTVAPANAETLENAGPAASATDQVGTTGLQYRYQKQLAGRPGVSLTLADAGTGAPEGSPLHTSGAKPGKAVRTTIDAEVQRAAEEALAGLDKNAALVAVKPSTGDILAVADNPPTGENRSLRGKYPPGSDFKVVSTAALLGDGLDAGTPVPCPKYETVNGRRFENQDTFTLPSGSTFTDVFAHSCNTGIIGLRDRLADDALATTAKSFGIGATWDVGATTFDGSVPVTDGATDLAAAMIGQGRVEASPLVMASVAATVKDGTFRQPVLVPSAVKKRHTAATPLDPDVAAQLRTLMRAVATDGSGKAALAGIPGEPAAKTGTAEFGTDTPPRTHAWFIGYRGDLAYAVLIEDGGSGGKDAGPIAAKFLRGLPV